MLTKKRKEDYAERLHPGDRGPEPCSPGSIEQQLDMCEEGELKGDELLYLHGKPTLAPTEGPRELDELINTNWESDLSEENREGDEMSGDEHSSGLQGTDVGLPGERTRLDERVDDSFGITQPEEAEIPQKTGKVMIIKKAPQQRGSQSKG